MDRVPLGHDNVVDSDCGTAVDLSESDFVLALGGCDGRNAVSNVDILDLTVHPPCWREAPHMSVARRGHAAVSYKAQVFVIGGYCEAQGGALACVEVFDLTTGWWRQAPPIPTPRYDLAGVVSGGRVFALGGRGGGRLHNAVESCDVDSKQWESHEPMYRARSGLGAAACGNLVFAVGGNFNSLGDAEPTASVEYFDAKAGKWFDAPHMHEGRCDVGVVCHEGRIVVVGGTSTHGSSVEFTSGCSKTIEIFDIAKWAWQAGPSMTYAGSGLGAAVHNGKIIVLGGAFAGNASTKVEALDLSVQPFAWDVWSSLTRPCWGAQLVAYDGAPIRQVRQDDQEAQSREDCKVKARCNIMEAIAVRDAKRLADAIEEGASAGLVANELSIGQRMLHRYDKDGFMVGFDGVV